MKKNFKFYAALWAVLIVVYNVIVFAVRPIIPGYVIHYDVRFWLAWAFVTASFIGQLFCAFIAFKSPNKEKLFLNIPLVTESYSALVAMAAVSSVLMLMPSCPDWIAAIVCLVIFGFSAITLLKAKSAANMVSDVGAKVKGHTFFIKSLTADMEGLLSCAKTDAIKSEVKKVYEAVRYSDPMSNDALAGLEAQITLKFDALSKAVELEDAGAVKAAAEEFLILINDRNKKCKLLK